MTKLQIVLIMILSFFTAERIFANNATKDSTFSFNTLKLFQLKNQWLNSGNIAGLTFNANENIGEVFGEYNLADGDYKRVREASHIENYSLSSESYLVLNDTYFYGNLAYQNSDETGNLYTGLFNPYRGNPYVIGDSIPGANIHKEAFNLSGGVAKKLTNILSFGLLADYHIGKSAKQKDPRPRTVITDFSLRPSIIIHFPNKSLGFDLAYRNRKEDIDYLQVVTDDPDPTYFMFKGMGFYSSETGQTKSRFYNQNNISAGTQLDTKLNGFSSLTEIRATYSKEITEDGTTTIKKADAGDWKTFTIALNQQFTRHTQSAIQKITFRSSYFDGDGIEYIQDAILNDDKQTEYITLSKNLKLNRKEFDAALEYKYLKLYNHEQINWESRVYAHYKLKKEKYYYIPEIFNADYSNLELGVNFEKDFYFGKFLLAPGIELDYRYNLDQELNLSSDETITRRQNKQLYIHDFEYETADCFNVSPQFYCGYKLPKSESIDELFLKIRYEFREVNDSNENVGILTAKLGFMF
ncbi:DUF6850 family outer membrane beta-barrel protein [uncultured Draconibacterium sp.]|uniref:DUF6850 family outer membrane beta-barrel protein n=1 Tax=uncultured Draconibacterium sp. TaxID=1573823 RepID=UPI0025F979CC|nr:DUF6850 family outer membrane beta-barrel protein [uncultured Draconibacterium sp.]